MWLLSGFYRLPSLPVLPSFLPFLTLFGETYCSFLISVCTCLDWHIVHVFQKKSKASEFSLLREKKERSCPWGRELKGFSLLKNNSHVTRCFSLSHVLVLVQREGAGRMECPAVHPAGGSSQANGTLVFIPVFVWEGTELNVCRLRGSGVSTTYSCRVGTCSCCFISWGFFCVNWTHKFLAIRVARGSSGCRPCVEQSGLHPVSWAGRAVTLPRMALSHWWLGESISYC